MANKACPLKNAGKKELEVIVDRLGDGRILKWYDNVQMSELQNSVHRHLDIL